MARKTGCVGNFFFKYELFFWLGVLSSEYFMFPNTVSVSAIICAPEPLITFFSAIPCSQYNLAQEQSIFYNGGEKRTVGGRGGDQTLAPSLHTLTALV